mgnify:FL=1
MKIGNFGNSDRETASAATGTEPDRAGVEGQRSMVDPKSLPQPEVQVKDKPPTPASSLVDALENGFRRDVSELSDVVAPIRTYKERLQDEGIAFEYAKHVLDTLLMNGTHYAEDVKITSNLTVRFRTRMYLDTMRIYDAIEKASPRYADTTDSIQVRYMLAASLESYGRKTFRFADTTGSVDLTAVDAMFQERLSFIYTLSDLAIRVLAREFGKFDRKLSLILSDGAVEAF